MNYRNILLFWLLLIFTAFPYFTFGLSFFKDSYLQPFAIFTSVLISIFNFQRISINREVFAFSCLTLGLLIIIMVKLLCSSFIDLLSHVNLGYLSPFIFLISLHSYRLVIENINKSHIYKFFCFVILVYLLVGLIQIYVYPDFLTSSVGGNKVGLVGLDGGRGAISLASEPGYYAFHMLSLATITYLLGKGKIYILSILQVIFTAYSATGAATLFLGSLVYSLFYSHKKLLTLLVLLISLFVTYSFVINSNIDTRMFNLLKVLFSGDLDFFLYLDQSSSERIVNTIYPIVYAFHNWFIPSMLSTTTWPAYLNDLPMDWFTDVASNTRIMSGFGEVVVFYGIFSLPLIYLFISRAFSSLEPNHAYRCKKLTRLFSLVMFFMVLGTYGLATPTLGFIYVLFEVKQTI